MAKRPNTARKPKTKPEPQAQESISLNTLTLTEADFSPEVVANLANASLDAAPEPVAVPMEKPNGQAGTKLTNAGAEILETSEVIQVTKTESELPSETAKPRIKPAMLSIAADDQRKKDLEEAYTASPRSGRRMNLVAGHKFVEEHFSGRDADSVSLDEYVAYRDAAFAALPPEAGDFQFTQEANNFVQSRGFDLKSAICEFFKGQHNVALEEIRQSENWERILMKQAEIYVESRPKNKKAARVDSDMPVRCQSSPDCTRIFVPLAWLEFNKDTRKDVWTGNVLVTKTGDQKWYCQECRALGRKHEVPFYSVRSAEQIAERILQAHRRERGTLASLEEAAGYHASHEKREDHSHQRAGKFNKALADRCNNPFSALLNNPNKDHPNGRYYSPEFEWDTNAGKVQTFLDLSVSRDSLTVSDVGPGLEFLKAKHFNTGYFENQALLCALRKAADAQQS